jgi:hypothetical protein
MTNLTSAVLIISVDDVVVNSSSFESLQSQFGKSAGTSFEECDRVVINNSTFNRIINPSEPSAIYIKHSIILI